MGQELTLRLVWQTPKDGTSTGPRPRATQAVPLGAWALAVGPGVREAGGGLTAVSGSQRWRDGDGAAGSWKGFWLRKRRREARIFLG